MEYYNNNIFAANLRAQLDKKDMTAADLAKKLDCSKSIVSEWLKAKKLPRMDKVETMCQIFGCSRDDLISEPKNTVPFPVPLETVPAAIKITGFIPVYGEIPAGVPNFEDCQIIDYISTTNAHPEEYFALRVKGTSMIGAGIPDGSYVTVKKQSCAENGDIVACRVNGEEATLKRFRRDGDTVILMPENPEFSPILVSAKEFADGRAQILGVAKEITKKL